MASPSFASEPSGLVHGAIVGRQVDLPTPAERNGDDAACLRPLRVVLEFFLIQSRHICLCLGIDLLDRWRTANKAQVDASGRVDGGRRMTGVAESEAERHREAGGVRSGEQLLGL